MTKPGPLWNPGSEDELRSAADNGVLTESHHLDLKRELGRGNAANRDLAKDIAAFTLDGGIIIIGVDEDTSPPSLHEVDLQGLPERVELIARTRIDEGVLVTTVPIESKSDPSRGYLVVHVPASPRAPHMVDGKYYGRGDKTNRILSHAEVLRLHERQLAAQRDIILAAKQALEELVGDPTHPVPTMVVLAEPLGTAGDLLVPLVESTDWQQTVLDMLQASAIPEHQNFSTTLVPPTSFVHRGNGVAATRGMHDGGRFTAEQQRAVELLLNESGAVMLASRRPVDFAVDGGQPLVMEVVVLGQTDLLVRSTALVSERFGLPGYSTTTTSL